ncbi:MAG TPA: hypothetical protein PLU72_00040 [Candidatus Ozemobacteraceae bacterium]|nr:hypothetical protein [Candidatus Ozemobacteraceae bacterium]HQG29533.1 hypothetical protein [Candidatus Ozemobacteraceae bacterium]
MKDRHAFPLLLPVLFIAACLVATLLSTGCNDQGTPLSAGTAGGTPWFYPTIASLTVTGNSIKQADGGILTLSCSWVTATPIAAATGVVALASTVANPGPTGIVSSGTASASFRASVRGAGFFDEFASPLEIPTSLGAASTEGIWQVQLPFPVATVASATVGKHQMLLWMIIDGYKTNSLAFELEIK